LIFDLRLVTGIDSSATHSFSQIKQAAAKYGTEIVLVNVSPELQRAFSTADFISDNVTVGSDLDRALETCEQKVIEMYQAEDGDARSLLSWLSEALGSMENADRLAKYCRRLEVAPGDIIARQGDVASSMHFILEGRVGINVDAGEGRTMRVRSLGRHTTIGEMGLITRRPRSATIRAEAASVLYELRTDAFDQIRLEQPALGEALLSYIIAVMAERLSFANRAIGVLQR
jgi:SulP family sulfate permease